MEGTYIDEGLLCHRETGFGLEHPRTTQKRKVEKELDKNDKKRKLKCFERPGDSSRQKQGSDGVDSWRPCVPKLSNRKLV